MLPQQDNQRTDGQHGGREIHTKISGAFHIGAEILPCMRSCWLDRARKSLKNLILMMSDFSFPVLRIDGGQNYPVLTSWALRDVTPAIAKRSTSTTSPISASTFIRTCFAISPRGMPRSRMEFEVNPRSAELEPLSFGMENWQFRCLPRRNAAGNFAHGVKSSALQQARGDG